MITQEILAAKILDCLNGQLSLAELVHWAEDAIVEFTESDERPPNANTVWDVLLYLGAGDSPDFPLTWEVIRDTLERLGRPVQRVAAWRALAPHPLKRERRLKSPSPRRWRGGFRG